jgi:hypothetical protein
MCCLRFCITLIFASFSGLVLAMPSCDNTLFIDTITNSAWTAIDVLPEQGTAGVRDALVTARDQYFDKPVRIRLAAGAYTDNLGHEIYAQRLLRGASNPIYLVAADQHPNATVLEHGINLLGVSYVAIKGVTIGPPTVGAWNGTSHASPLPLSAAAGIHIAGEADNALANAASGAALDYNIYGRYLPSNHIIIQNVTVQNLFDPTDLDAETSEGQGMDGMKFNQVEDLWVLDSGVTQVTRHGIDNVGVHRAAFCRNVITRTGGGQGIEAKGGSADILFDSNTFYRVRRVELGGENTDATYYFSPDGRWDYEALNLIARNNLIIDPREAALEFSGCIDCTATGNSILFSASYKVPADGGTVYGGDAIRVHDSLVLGAKDGGGNDCQWWDSSIPDYVTIDPCWGVGSQAPAPIDKILRTDNATVVNNLIASVNGTFSNDLGGSTLPCPLNIIDGTATLHFDANFWWNGSHPLPADGCSLLPEGAHSVVPISTPFTAPPLAANDIDGATLASVDSSAIAALTPPQGSALANRAIANSASSAYDRIGAPRNGIVGALAGGGNIPVATGTVVEFYNTNLDNYFITADANEAAGIDGGSAGPGWIRTGYTFASGGSTPVCRFYGSQSPGPNSHFYTVDAAECEGLKQLQASTPATEKRWNFESLDFISTPPTGGSCSAGTVPVYRAYNNGFSRGVDSNHRIASSSTALQEVVTRGWINEGVVMCAPNQ